MITFPQSSTAVVGAVFGVGLALGAGGTWLYVRTRRRSLLHALAVASKNPDLDPANRDMETILRELQIIWNLPGDGKWTAQTEALIVRHTKVQATGTLAKNPASEDEESPVELVEQDELVELEPDEDWEVEYERGLDAAFDQALTEPEVVSYDQAVIYVLTVIFPAHGRFHDNPAMGPWKERARGRARADLAKRLGDTEAEARAVLSARTAGASAANQGLGLGAVVRAMGQHAFPTENWSSTLSPWQRLFAQRAATELQSVAGGTAR